MATKDHTKPEEYKIPVERTYGEKVHAFIFDNFLNFWVNLIASGAFNYWVHNYSKPVKMLGNVTPFTRYENLRDFIKKALPQSARGDRGPATAMADVFTLLLPGHVVMIPSVWIGSKFKEPIVKWLDRMHYGRDAEQDLHIAERHRKLEIDPRPSLFGAVMGRIGTMVATQFYARTIGGRDNVVQWSGTKVANKTGQALQKFPGIDKFSSDIGLAAGKAFKGNFKARTDKLNEMARKWHFDWSPDQKAHLTPGPDGKFPAYDHFPEDFGRYLALDVIYTSITAMTIHPFINWMRKWIPGMTYKGQNAKEENTSSARTLRRNTVPEGPAHQRPTEYNQSGRYVSNVRYESALDNVQRSAEIGAVN